MTRATPTDFWLNDSSGSKQTKYKFLPTTEHRDVFLNENFSSLSEFVSVPRLQLFKCVVLCHDVFIQKSQNPSGRLVGGYFIV